MTRNTVILYLLRFAQVILSVVSLSLVAKYFGITLDRDTWLIALNCIVVIDLALWGPVNQTFRAKFVLLKEHEGESVILDKTRSLLLAILLVSLVVIGAILLFPSAVAGLLAPTYEGEQLQALVTMLMLIAPSLLLNQFCQIGVSILNAYQSFFIPEISQLITTVFNILCLIYLAPHIGIYALLISYYIGLVVFAGLLIVQLNRRKIPLFKRFREVKLRGFYPFFLYALPFFVPYFFVQVNLVVEKSLGNILGEGIVSVLDYSRKFVEMPINVLSSVLMTMLVPVLSVRFARGDASGFWEEFRKVYQLGMLVVAALISFFISSSAELISVILFRGEQMDKDTISTISDLSKYYACTTLINFHYIIFGMVLLAAGRGKIYALFGVIAQLIMIGFNFVWYERVGPYVFPISFFIAHAVAAVFLFFYFPGSKRRLSRVTLKYVSVLGIAIAIPWIVAYWLNEEVRNHFVSLAINTFTIGLTLLISAFAFRLEERLLIIRLWKGFVNIVGRLKR